MIHIRHASPADAPALARMNAAFNGVSDPAERIAARLAACAAIETPLLAELDGQTAGFTCVRVVPCVLYAEPYAELTELYVEPAYRQRGVGRALLARAEALAHERGAADLIIMTGVGNAAAQALYRAAGYDTYAVALNRKIAHEH
ncbi:MAG TPA: GNAT family N-acetyltransferase [Roseiflexaceae bacterium]|nr:GNAT family N-acetyltransferase [Roseiflexaceae bacterium]